MVKYRTETYYILPEKLLDVTSLHTFNLSFGLNKVNLFLLLVLKNALLFYASFCEL